MADDSRTSRPLREPEIIRTLEDILGRSVVMRDIAALVDKIADTSMSACGGGEPGTGKRHVGRAIHNSSSRRTGPFVVVDCAQHPEEVIEGHLFGMPNPPVNGVPKANIGLLARAQTGTLVLNDLPALGLRLQAKLLETLPTRRLPDSHDTPLINVRVLATMSTDPVRAVDEGTLIEDLYYRVAVVLFRMPALRERPEDIPDLVAHFLGRFSARYGTTVTLAPGIVERMLPWPWPGNVRQLADLLRHAFLLAEGDAITDNDLSRATMALERAGGASPLRKVSEHV